MAYQRRIPDVQIWGVPISSFRPLYQRTRDGSFTDVTEAAGLANAENNYGMGAAPGDYNNDGFIDLYVTTTTDTTRSIAITATAPSPTYGHT